MIFLVVLLASIGLCAGIAIPLVPGDNSHYVEGKSRYIWMPDSEGNPYLVDLQASVDVDLIKARSGTRNEYWLFTRQNPTNRQILVNGDANSIRNSNYNGYRPTKVIVHGWNSDGNTNMNSLITSAFLAVADVNIIILDWRADAAGPLYTPAVLAVPGVGIQLANFLNFIFVTVGGNWNNIHLIGHSLGAHVVGNTGRAAGARVTRITGMDPAGPQWGGNSNALNRYSGVYVESIHTNGGNLGIMEPISDADFYPNGGRRQPGCSDFICDHRRAPELFASSIRSSHLVGRLCTSLSQAESNQCTGATLPLGNSNLGKRGQGLYGLTTGSSWPF